MDLGEFLTRSTIWVSLVGYAIGSVVFAISRGRARWDAVARVIWSVACASLIAHFISAFQFYHGWSHTVAYRDTAQQTDEVIGLNWGGGLLINYALLTAWIVDVVWWWRSGVESYRKRPRYVVGAWHGFLIFIIFNATVIFGGGIVRWFGLVLCLLLTIAWLYIFRNNSRRQ